MVTFETNKLLRGLSPADLEALRRIACSQQFLAGAEIFKEGDEGDGVYVVKEGLVEISGLIGANVRHVFSKAGPGDLFGEMAVIDQKPRSACATAREATTVYFIPSATIMELAEKSPMLSLALLREVSQRLREFNRQYVREVIQTERLALIGRFARSIIHDLKNPLNIIGITAEMAGKESATPAFRQQANLRIRKQVERISELITEILEFTQGSPADIVLAPTDYGAFVQQLIEEVRAELALKSVVLELENSLPATQLRVNPKRLRRLFYNLFHNSTDAMPEGGKITVRFPSPGSAGRSDEVITEIEDTGTGIAPEIAGQLFEAFASYGKTHGTGLGLTICKRIIEDHRGWISARTEPGRGAVFRFGLPRAKE